MRYSTAASANAELFSGIYDSIEEALRLGPAEHDLEPGQSIYIGEFNVFQPHIDFDTLIEQLQSDCDEHCGEASDLWDPRSASKEERAELETELNDVLQRWMEKHKCLPACGQVTNVKQFTVPERGTK